MTRHEIAKLAFSLLLVLLVAQVISGSSAEAHNARVMSVVIAAVLVSGCVVALVAVSLRLVAQVLDDRSFGTHARRVREDKRSIDAWHRRVDRMASVPLNRIPERRVRLRELVRLKEFRKEAEAQGLEGAALMERIWACRACLDRVEDGWTREDLKLQLVALGPLDDYLLEVWRLESEAVEESRREMKEKRDRQPHSVRLAPPVLAAA